MSTTFLGEKSTVLREVGVFVRSRAGGEKAERGKDTLEKFPPKRSMSSMLDGGKRKKEQNFEKEEVEEEEKNSREMLATFFLPLKIKERKIKLSYPSSISRNPGEGKSQNDAAHS